MEKKLRGLPKSSIFAGEISFYHVKQHSHPQADALHHPPAVHDGLRLGPRRIVRPVGQPHHDEEHASQREIKLSLTRVNPYRE